MTDTNDTAPKKRGGGLSGMLLADLKTLASQLGISGSRSMKKAQLVEAISAHQSGGGSGQPSQPREQKPQREEPATPAPEAREEPKREEPKREEPKRDEPAAKEPEPREEPPAAPPAQRPRVERQTRQERSQRNQNRQPDGQAGPAQDQTTQPDRQPDRQQPKDQQDRQADRQQADRQQARDQQAKEQQAKEQQAKEQQAKEQQDRQQGKDQPGRQNRQDRQPAQRDQNPPRDQNPQRDQQGNQRNDQQGNQRADERADQNPNDGQDDDGDGDGSRRNRRRRGRDRDRTRTGTGTGAGTGLGGQRNEPDTTILEDDVLVPAAGILDVLDNYAFVRTSGYLPGPDDVYLSLSMVRRYGLRRGDAVVGQVRQPREGERKEKFNPMVRIDNVNGSDPEQAKNRPDFADQKPLHPSERLRLETGPDNTVGRVVDLVAPIGKGQRGLVVAPASVGSTRLLQAIAGSVTRNNPECHLMVVLLDERPEEVTDYERSVKGEVIASTFDRPPADHTMLAELAIERAKRLVELGHDVVVLLDGLTRLGRAYNLSAPSSGRNLPGGVDAAALFPPKRFFGAARSLEDAGSLTIIATALVETGSEMDEVIFESLRSTSNWELRLSRGLAEVQLFPAVDAVASATRHEEALVSSEELAIRQQLRRTLAAAGAQGALELLIDRIGSTQTNIELLTKLRR